MAKDFKIVISATDKATASIKRINKSMEGLARPVENVKKIGAEIAKNPVAKGVKVIGKAVSGVVSSLAKVAAPMLGITGIGVIAGLANATTQWARLGLEIKNTAGSLGSTTSGLQTMRGAAKMVGLSGEQMTGGLESIRQSMQDAKWGRNPALLTLMSKIGISFRTTKDGSIDAIESLKDVADAIARTKDVGAQHTIAQAFGLEALLPLLIKGKKGIEEYQKSIEDLGGVMSPEQIERAAKFTGSLNKLSDAASGVKNAIGDKLIPSLQPIIDGVTEYLSKNKDRIANVVAGITADFIGGPADKKPQHEVSGIIKPVGGASPPQPVASKIKSPEPPAPQTGDSKIKPIGLAVPQAPVDKSKPVAPQLPPLGIRSNNPLNLMPGGREAVYPSVDAGIIAAIQNLQGKKYFGGGNDTVAGIVNTWSPPNAPGNSSAKNANYISAVTKAVGPGHLDGNDPKVIAKLISAMAVQENGTGTFDKAKMDDTIQRVVVEFKNAPPGMTATTRTSSGAAAPVRIASAMPAMGAP